MSNTITHTVENGFCTVCNETEAWLVEHEIPFERVEEKLTAAEAYAEAYRAAKSGNLNPGTIRIRLIGGKNSGVEGTLDGTTRMARRGNITLGADLEGIGIRYVADFLVIS